MIAEREGHRRPAGRGPESRGAEDRPGRREFAITVKGQPFPMHECRTRHGQALGYAVSPTGADHMHNFWDRPGAATRWAKACRTWASMRPCPQTELNAHKVRAYIVRSATGPG